MSKISDRSGKSQMVRLWLISGITHGVDLSIFWLTSQALTLSGANFLAVGVSASLGAALHYLWLKPKIRPGLKYWMLIALNLILNEASYLILPNFEQPLATIMRLAISFILAVAKNLALWFLSREGLDRNFL